MSINYIEIHGKFYLYARCKEIPCEICQHYNQPSCKGSIVNNYVLSKPIAKAYIGEIIRNAITDVIKSLGKGV